MELNHLRYFLAVAQEQNYARAARRLAVAPSTLYRRLKDLELDLGVSLFDRNAGTVRLSTAGRLFESHARTIVADATRIAERMSSLARGRTAEVRIGVNGIAAQLPEISRALIRAREELPDLTIRLVAVPSEEQFVRLHEGRIDIGLVYTRTDADQVGHVAVQRQRFVLVTSNDHPLLRAPVRLRDLAREDFIFQVRIGRGVIHDRLIAACAARGLQPRITNYILDEDAQMAMVAAGMGVTFTLEGAAQRRWRNYVTFHSVDDLDVTVNLDLIWNSDTLSQAAARTIDVIKREALA